MHGNARNKKKIRAHKPRKKREFASVEHLSAEAVAAFADGELAESAAHRARVHLVQCDQCREETHEQRGASALLKSSNESADLRAPQELVSRLMAMAATAGPLDGPTAESVPVAEPENFGDRMEMMLRAFRKIQRG